MSARKTENTSVLEMFEVPPEIAQRTREQLAVAPFCGLGFKRGRLDSDLHGRMLEKLAESASQFRAESRIDEVRSCEPSMIPALYYEDKDFNAAVSKALQSAHEEWSGMSLRESACYGFRVYQRGSFLHNHVDRTNTHIISSTICVDHRLDSPWPLYIEDIDGKPYQVNMEPGEFVFYEGARLIHGRPWVLNGDYYIGMFVHYCPVNAISEWNQAR
jgi:hypothetical protein